KEALKQALQLRKSAPQTYKKLETVLLELKEHPYTGTGQPEQMKYIQGMWSRKLDKKNRLRYTVEEKIVTVHVVSVSGHYDDK
ncbi:MAG: type II toxin-antitoxin system YoeB family toxin, partial [Tannerella sp.]|nr:type II toxin-antitoxin system YoeB family toxin [Tannerella sp.]